MGIGHRMMTAGFVGIFMAACGGGEPEAEAPAGESAAEASAMEAEQAAGTAGTLAGWQGRTDGGEPLDGVTVTSMDGGWRVDNGPAVVLWRDDREATGVYRLAATFRQIDSKGMVHGTGLVFGGNDMTGAAQAYTYFMVRGDGDFLVKTRSGEDTYWVEPTDGWVSHEAVNPAGEDDRYTNELAVQVGEVDVAFLVNGTEVFRAPREEIFTEGSYGVRLNHNLTVEFSEITVESEM